MSHATDEWLRLMGVQVNLRRRIHAQHRLIIGELETPEERAEMRERLAKADQLLTEVQERLTEIQELLGEWNPADALAERRCGA